MDIVTVGLLVVLVIVLGAEFVNGWTDAPNAIATAVTTRVLSPSAAIAMAVVMNIAGTLSGTAVAATVGKGIVNAQAITLLTVAAALIGPIIWSALAAHFGIPTSKSHGLLAGFAGAALATAGPTSLLADGWIKVGIGIIAALALGGFMGWLFTKIIRILAHEMQLTKGKRRFDRLQVFASALVAYNHGLNDGQKYVGMFTLALVMGGVLPEFVIPWWVMIVCALVMGLGTAIGGRKIIGTIGERISRIESWQGVGSSLGASATIATASLFGVPLSTTHASISAVTGAGVVNSPARVRWEYPRRIMYAAVITFPLCGSIAFIVCEVFEALAHLFY